MANRKHMLHETISAEWPDACQSGGRSATKDTNTVYLSPLILACRIGMRYITEEKK